MNSIQSTCHLKFVCEYLYMNLVIETLGSSITFGIPMVKEIVCRRFSCYTNNPQPSNTMFYNELESRIRGEDVGLKLVLYLVTIIHACYSKICQNEPNGYIQNIVHVIITILLKTLLQGYFVSCCRSKTLILTHLIFKYYIIFYSRYITKTRARNSKNIEMNDILFQ